jgi:metal-sulfur cluster biosynthetic enzyme
VQGADSAAPTREGRTGFAGSAVQGADWAAPTREGRTGFAGSAVEARLLEMPSRDDVMEALRQVEDPELGMDIVDLGLMYDVKVDGPKVHVLFTLTSMGCPVGPMIEQQIQEVTYALPGVEEVEAELTWDPPWSPEKMSDDAKFILGFG